MVWDLMEAIRYYEKQGAPRDQGALTSLLREIQREQGGKIPKFMLPTIAQAYGVPESLLLALIRRIPSLRLEDTHCLELCAGPNCGKHTALADAAEKLRSACGGKFTLKYGPCMRQCGKGPNLKWDGRLYNQADDALLRQLLKEAGIDFESLP